MPVRRKRFELMVFEPQRHRLLVGEEIGDPDAAHLFLCLPGLLETRASFEEFVSHMGPRARIMTLDWCGRGDSDRLTSAHDYRMSAYLSDLSLFYAHATGTLLDQPRIRVSGRGTAAQEPITSVHLVGTSMGGLLGVFLASHAPKFLGGLVLNDVGPLLPWSGVFSLMTGISSAKSMGLMSSSQQPSLAEQLNVDPHLLQAVRQPGHLDLPHETRLSGVDFSDIFEKISAPILLLHGEQSEITNPSVIKKLCALHPATKVHHCKDSGHPVQYTAEVCDEIYRFVDGL